MVLQEFADDPIDPLDAPHDKDLPGEADTELVCICRVAFGGRKRKSMQHCGRIQAGYGRVSKGRRQKAEGRRQNTEYRIQNTEYRIQNLEP
jgi:hypothetical protein